jgi:hypothetical protein
MEIAVVSMSATEVLAEYLRTRLPARRFVPLAAFLWGAAALGPGRRGPLAILLAWGLVALFRLLDDLASARADAALHPERITVRAPRRWPFLALAFALLVFDLAWLGATSSGIVVAVFAILGVAALAWYGRLQDRCRSRLVRSRIVLLKYPIFVYLLAGPTPELPAASFVSTLALVYLTMALHEGLHDPQLRAEPGAFALLVGEAIVLVGVALAVASGPVAVVAVGLGAALIGRLLAQHRRAPLPSPWPLSVFLVAALWLSLFALTPSEGAR